MKVRSNSQLVTQQFGQCKVKEDRMKTYVEKVRELENRFNGMSIEHIARTENQRADFLAKIGSSLIDVMGVGRGDHVFAIFDVTEDWRSAITQFLEGKGRESKKEEEILERRARFYYLICFSERHFCQQMSNAYLDLKE